MNRKLSEDEIEAIAILLQEAENIGTRYCTDAQTRDCILKAEADMPTVRAKDVDIAWTIEVLNGAKKYRADINDGTTIQVLEMEYRSLQKNYEKLFYLYSELKKGNDIMEQN